MYELSGPTDSARQRAWEARRRSNALVCEPESAWKPEVKERPDAKGGGWILACGAIVMVVLIALSTRSAPTEKQDDLHRASQAVRAYVEARIKAPATARFGDAKVTPKGEGPAGSLYSVSASVDSQNGFGALLRTTYECGVLVKGNTPRVLGCHFN